MNFARRKQPVITDLPATLPQHRCSAVAVVSGRRVRTLSSVFVDGMAVAAIGAALWFAFQL